ncbi:DHH family phosphoesterase [Candidatus Woesearchaeota archaeon]|jgi:single-stranded-DNA-specific exonuclease|nr:DHH family phosphoesterase [Candidatus Woesearchaeota archaeon]
MKLDLFFNSLKIAVSKFREIYKNKRIKIISHLDADGISAASILIKALERENVIHSISIVSTLDSDNLENILNEEFDIIFFTDLGSGQFNLITKKIKDLETSKQTKIPVFILDHHKPESQEIISSITHINPHFQEIDGGSQVSGSGVVYLFCKELNKKNKDSAHLAVIGAIGDAQEINKKGFVGLNKQILEDAISNNTIEVITGLNFFGAQTKPLYKLLDYCTDPYIPGVSGNESGAIKFLQDLGIEPKTNSKNRDVNPNPDWKKLNDLSAQEIQDLRKAIILKRKDQPNPENIFGLNYILLNEEPQTPFRDAREFSTLLNSCGRLNKASLGIGACLNNTKIKKEALLNLAQYKKEILGAITWFNNHRNGIDVIEKVYDPHTKKTLKTPYIIINAQDNIMHTMIGTLASIISRGKFFPKGTFILSIAWNKKDFSKISLRIAQSRNNKQLNLRNTLQSIIKKVGGECGGHQYAAGALIETSKEKAFIGAAIKFFKQLEKNSKKEIKKK